MKLVITGASGQLGRGASVRRADFAEPRTLRSAFAGAERLLLVSATDLAARTVQHRAARSARVT